MEEWSDGNFVIPNLVGGYTYYFRASPVDLAGNNNPNNPLHFTLVWNSSFADTIVLPSKPLKPVMIGKIRNIEVNVDENLDGTYEISLEEYTGNELSAMKANQYWVDYNNGKIIFGDGDKGYLPPSNSSISISYSGFDVFRQLHLWKDPERLLSLVELVVMDRGGQQGTEHVPNVAGAEDAHFVPVRKIDISSTNVRVAVNDGQNVGTFIPAAVEEIIVREGLYRI